MIVRLLRDSEIRDHKLYLVRKDSQDLIEVSSDGDRSNIQRELRLTREELSRIGFSTSVKGTNWSVVSIYTPDLFNRDKVKNNIHVMMGLSGFVIMGIVLIILVQRAERKRLEAELELINAKEVADMANLAKTQFLSNMSHELRTPLTSIMGFSELLAADNEHPLTEDQLEDVNYISKAGLHLLDLINEILDLTKIESGYLTMDLVAMNANEIIDDAISLVEPLADKRSIQIFNKLDSHVNYTVSADESRFREVILNLLSNAIKYNNENGAITVQAEFLDKDKGVRISVSDTGPGLSSKKQKDVFEPFNRLGAGVHIEGTGIGLTITKRLVELMNGEIGVTSKEGIGSTFWISLPRADEPD
jgi:signal transduction histidine kinase